MLHAWRLAFRHPRTGERVELEAPPPPDFAGALAALHASR
jgi:23S rRNA pseudouridine1911/1915/1917 synthase